LLFFTISAVHAQNDSLSKPAPVKKNVPPVHSPHKAAAMSAIVPGLGQFYNHKYWKIPVIYVAGIGLGYFLWYEQGNMDYYNFNYQQSVNLNYYKMDPAARFYNTDQLLEEKNRFNHYRDLAFIGCLALYTINVLDAAVDAHLWHFDQRINDDLGMRVSPSVQPGYGSLLPVPGLHLTFCLK
jgi:hypothetical protein